MTNVIMSSESIETTHMNINLSPGIADLTKENFNLYLNDLVFTNFHIEKLNTDGTLYSIIPTIPFSIYDEVRIALNKNGYSINALKVYIAKYFYNGGGIFLYNVPQVPSGVYNLSVTKINDMDFLLTTDPITICNGVNKDSSYLETDKAIYSLGEPIQLSVNLLDNDTIKVPDGKYVIKIALEKI